MAKTKIVDPTANVIALVSTGLESERRERLQLAKSLRREAKMREHFAHQLRRAESKRIDSNLSAIVATAQRAIDTQIETAKTLAATVEITKNTLESSLDAKLKPIIDDVTQLKNAFYLGAGAKQATVDTKSERRASMGQIVALISAIAAVVTIPITIYVLTLPGH
jgi:hypothetical protein